MRTASDPAARSFARARWRTLLRVWSDAALVAAEAVWSRGDNVLRICTLRRDECVVESRNQVVRLRMTSGVVAIEIQRHDQRVARGALGGGYVTSDKSVVSLGDRVIGVARKVEIGRDISPWGEGEGRPKGNIGRGCDSGTVTLAQSGRHNLASRSLAATRRFLRRVPLEQLAGIDAEHVAQGIEQVGAVSLKLPSPIHEPIHSGKTHSST